MDAERGKCQRLWMYHLRVPQGGRINRAEPEGYGTYKQSVEKMIVLYGCLNGGSVANSALINES